MKKKPYNIPTINTITLNQPLLETISGQGQQGGSGWGGKSKRYSFYYDDEEEYLFYQEFKN